MSTLKAELKRIRKQLEATRKELPSSPEMPEDLTDKPCPKDDEITKWNFKTIEKYKLKHK